MNILNLENINAKSPYKVMQLNEFPHLFYFHTDYGVDYEISIKANDMFVRSGAFILDIRNIWGQTSPNDIKVRQTLIVIVEELFSRYNEVLLYITETDDGKQSFRDRLFVRWFNAYEHHEQFFIQTAEGKMEGQMNFLAIISRKDNPKLPQAIKEFEETIAFLFD
ncbi:MAG: hypothetical protein J1F13_04265 [Prevotellaceae bacterium]|nr:hypothetical protein [Prevotellaceae bacterium]